MKMVQKADAARPTAESSDGEGGLAGTRLQAAASGDEASAGDEEFHVSDAEPAAAAGSGADDAARIEAELIGETARRKPLAKVQLREVDEHNALLSKEYKESRRRERLDGEESGGNESDDESETVSRNAGELLLGEYTKAASYA